MKKILIYFSILVLFLSNINIAYAINDNEMDTVKSELMNKGVVLESSYFQNGNYYIDLEHLSSGKKLKIELINEDGIVRSYSTNMHNEKESIELHLSEQLNINSEEDLLNVSNSINFKDTEKNTVYSASELLNDDNYEERSTLAIPLLGKLFW